MRAPDWTEDEVLLLRKNIKQGYSKISKVLGTSAYHVRQKAIELGIDITKPKKDISRFYSEEYKKEKERYDYYQAYISENLAEKLATKLGGMPYTEWLKEQMMDFLINDEKVGENETVLVAKIPKFLSKRFKGKMGNSSFNKWVSNRVINFVNKKSK